MLFLLCTVQSLIITPGRRLLRSEGAHDSVDRLVDQMGVSPLWKRGFMGQGVKVALLDTGMTDGPRPVKHLGAHGLLQWLEMARTGGDTLGHGTFTASMIAGSNPLCLGIAPEATIIPYKVVTDEQRSQTKGFLEALTDAIDQAVHIIVLPIGGTVISPTPPHCKPLLTPTPCQRGFTRIHADSRHCTAV
jgi:subtilisin family serine protease